MVLAPDALTKVLAYRRPEVFAVASQIFFVDPQRRREETGWGDFHTREGHDGGAIRSAYSGGGPGHS